MSLHPACLLQITFIFFRVSELEASLQRQTLHLFHSVFIRHSILVPKFRLSVVWKTPLKPRVSDWTPLQSKQRSLN